MSCHLLPHGRLLPLSPLSSNFLACAPWSRNKHDGFNSKVSILLQLLCLEVLIPISCVGPSAALGSSVLSGERLAGAGSPIVWIWDVLGLGTNRSFIQVLRVGTARF